jgi:hypothetical protein
VDSYPNMQQRDHHDISLSYLQELQSACVQLSTVVSALVQAALQSTQRAAHGHKRTKLAKALFKDEAEYLDTKLRHFPSSRKRAMISREAAEEQARDESRQQRQDA